MKGEYFLRIPINIQSGFDLFSRKKFNAMVDEAERNTRLFHRDANGLETECVPEVFACVKHSVHNLSHKDISDINAYVSGLRAY